MYLLNGYAIIPQSLILLWLAFIIIYRRIYNSRINRKLNGENVRRIYEPWTVSVASLVILLAGMHIYSSIQASRSAVQQYYNPDGFRYISCSGETMQETEDRLYYVYYSNYSHEENEGYTKAEYDQNGFHYTVFTSKLFHDGMHPDMIIFTEYKGESDDFVTMYQTVSFLQPDEKRTVINLAMKNDNAYRYSVTFLSGARDCIVSLQTDYLDSREEAEAIDHGEDIEETVSGLKELSGIHDVFETELKPYH